MNCTVGGIFFLNNGDLRAILEQKGVSGESLKATALRISYTICELHSPFY